MSLRVSSLRHTISRIFRERELYLRSEGHIRYVTLKPYMLITMAGFLVITLITGVVSSFGYYFAHNSAATFRENLNKTTNSYKYSSEKSATAYQNQLNTVTRTAAVELETQKIRHARELTARKTRYTTEINRLRKAYEQQLAQFQSSINQVNGHMVNNQVSYLKELERLRSIYTSLQQRHIKLEDLMDQGWAPRMVTIPAFSQTENSKPEASGNQPSPKTTGSVRSNKQSSVKPGASGPGKSGAKPSDVAALTSSMQSHWKKQLRTSAQINFSARKRVKEIMQVLSRLKFDLSGLDLETAARHQSNTGGPFVELTTVDVAAISTEYDTLEFAALQPFQNIFQLENALLELPIRRPLSDLRSITSPFGPRMDPFRKIYAMHRGIDFRAPVGEPVLATAAGVVILRQKKSKTGYGRVLVIRHEHGMTTLYGHLSEFTVKVGDKVKTGDVVGKVGNTGRSNGPHLHYEIRVNDSHVDPIDYLEAATHVF